MLLLLLLRSRCGSGSLWNAMQESVAQLAAQDALASPAVGGRDVEDEDGVHGGAVDVDGQHAVEVGREQRVKVLLVSQQHIGRADNVVVALEASSVGRRASRNREDMPHLLGSRLKRRRKRNERKETKRFELCSTLSVC